MAEEMRAVSPVFLDLRGERFHPMPPPTAPCVISLGNFDGVHRAHAALIHASLDLRDEHFPHGLCGIFSFFHPTSDYRPTTSDSRDQEGSKMTLRNPSGLKHLTTLKEKLWLCKRLGADFACLCDFNDIRTLSPNDFLKFLTDHMDIRGVVCGFNFRFGIWGSGNAATLSAVFDHPENGTFCQVVPSFSLDGDTVSATRIRTFLSEGDAVMAAEHLGRPYALESRVVTGKQLGRKLGFPTANQNFLLESLVPARGVYAVLCHTPKGIFPGVANVGSHPTVDQNAPVNCETHIIGFTGDLYGYCMKIEFLCRLRDEERFPSPEILADAIAKDTQAAADYAKAYLKKQAHHIK